MPGVSPPAPRYEDWETEYDHYQHYFYDDDNNNHDPDEDFFKSTAPSEDIWKKFELVPTPPMSPIRTVDGAAKVGPAHHHHHHQSLGDKLEWVSQRLGQDEEHQELLCKVNNAANDSLSNLSSIIIQDCMWSGFSAGRQPEKVVEERRISASASPSSSSSSSCAGSVAAAAARVQTGPPGVQSSCGPPGVQSSCVPADAPPPIPVASLAADCVDPAAVLTFPLTGGCKKAQVSSSSESHSDSSDEDDDDEDDEEEIDVVTVEHKQQQQKSRRMVNSRQPVPITVRADHLDPCTERFHISIHQQQHNYAAPSPDTLPDPPLRKRARSDGPAHLPPPHPSQSPAGPQLHHQPRPGHAPSNSASGKCGAAAASRSASPDLASSPSAATSSFYEMPSSPPASYSSASSPPPGFSSHSHFSSPQSSDCEDTDKRRAHNFLERKRRNDLRSRFLLLRDEIPGLVDCPKTPKVAILTRATEYLQQLHANERQKAHERRQLKARQLQLQRRLAQLRRS